MIRVLVAEDMRILRDTLVSVLNLEDDIKVVAQVAAGTDIVPAALAERPDLAILDIDLPGLDGISAAAQLHVRLPACRVVILTVLGRPGQLREALDAHVSGFMVKDAPSDQLIDVLRRVAAGERVIDQKLALAALEMKDQGIAAARRDHGRRRHAGIANSAGVVSSAALIMVAVFSIFIGMGQVELKMLGIGLAAAILLDATIVRGVLLPAAMTLLGDRCWYLPRWLSRLPGRTSAEPGTTKSMPTALAASPGRSRNWATRGTVAAGRGIALVGLTLAGLVLWIVFATAVTLAPLGIGLTAIPVTVRAIRRLETRVRRLSGDWCGVAIGDPYRPEPARREGQPPSSWARFGFLIADPATWRDLVWITVDTLVGWLLTLAPAGLIAWGLFGVVMPAVWHPIVAAHGNNWYAFIHVTTASTAWLSAALGIAFIALGLLTAQWLLRRYGALAQSLLAPTRTV